MLLRIESYEKYPFSESYSEMLHFVAKATRADLLVYNTKPVQFAALVLSLQASKKSLIFLLIQNHS